jgi:hypothetical protein
MNGIINVVAPSEIQNTTHMPVLAFYGTRNSSGFDIPSAHLVTSCNSDYFTYSSSTRKFVCKKNFTGNIYVLSTANYSGAGSSNVITYCQWKLYIDDALYASVTTNSTVRYNTYTSVPFTSGKYTYIQGYCYSTAANKKSGTGDYLLLVTL